MILCLAACTMLTQSGIRQCEIPCPREKHCFVVLGTPHPTVDVAIKQMWCKLKDFKNCLKEVQFNCTSYLIFWFCFFAAASFVIPSSALIFFRGHCISNQSL